jgi:hypothetical protein
MDREEMREIFSEYICMTMSIQHIFVKMSVTVPVVQRQREEEFVSDEQCIQFARSLNFERADRMLRLLKSSYPVEADIFLQALNICIISNFSISQVVERDTNKASIIRCVRLYHKCMRDEQEKTRMAQNLLGGLLGALGGAFREASQQSSQNS